MSKSLMKDCSERAGGREKHRRQDRRASGDKDGGRRARRRTGQEEDIGARAGQVSCKGRQSRERRPTAGPCVLVKKHR